MTFPSILVEHRSQPQSYYNCVHVGVPFNDCAYVTFQGLCWVVNNLYLKRDDLPWLPRNLRSFCAKMNPYPLLLRQNPFLVACLCCSRRHGFRWIREPDGHFNSRYLENHCEGACHAEKRTSRIKPESL